jgi:2-polyprenyl-3-methyl-5-hydroxy-6-metoxy-1,4-benzoquinol methylase
MKRIAEKPYFIDDVFYGDKTPEMVEFTNTRVALALEMIRNERARTGNALRVLDVGCGDGTFSEMIMDMGNEVHGVDVRPDRVESARQKGVRAMVADLSKGLPFDNVFFDLVYASEVLEHIYDTEFFLQEARRVLKKNGALVVTVPNIACLPNRVRAILGLYPKYVAPARKHWGVGEHMRAFTKNVLTELLIRNGFQIEDVKANLLSIVPTKRTKKPWSKGLGKLFPSLGEVLVCKARRW